MYRVLQVAILLLEEENNIKLNIMFVIVALLGAPLLYADLGASLSLQAPRYHASAKHLEYVYPAASKQGELRLASFTRFNSLNPYLTKGIAPSGLGNTLETLAISTLDDPYTIYGLLAERFDYQPEVYTLYAHLAPNIRFHNGQLVTAQDIVRCFCLLKILVTRLTPATFEVLLLSKLLVIARLLFTTGQDLASKINFLFLNHYRCLHLWMTLPTIRGNP